MTDAAPTARAGGLRLSLLLGLAAFALDRLHKFVQVEAMHWPEGYFRPLTPFFDVGLVFNSGISYGLLSALPLWGLAIVIAAALAALVAARPTVGKPLVTGFSQGGIMTFALAVTHPEALAAAFPIGGLLPPSLYPSAALSSRPRPAKLPPVAAFHGASDLAVPTRGARASIAELRRAGYPAELREYAGVEHDISDEEEGEILERIGRDADGLVAAAPAP